MTQSIMDKIEQRITHAKEGAIFLTHDFTDVTNITTARKSLGRLVEKNIIRRVTDGIYEKPRYSRLLKEYIPANPDAIAYALAEHFHWNIAPSGEVALNRLGLSTQVPTVWVYVSDGPYRTYEFDGIQILFKHRTNRSISKMSSITIMVIEALNTLGKEHVNEETIQILKTKLSKKDKKLLLKEAGNTSEWIYEVIRKVGND